MIRRLARKTAVILACGYILFFYSERVFWSFRRPGDTSFDFAITWLAYSLMGWIVLDLVRRYRATGFSPVFLCGAVYGWVGEGVVVDTLYGDGSNPFPLSISWTGLAWHALLSVGVGWYLLGKALTREAPGRAAWLSVAIGLGWGLWAVWWPTELKDGDTSIRAFASHSLLTFLPFLASWLILGLARPEWCRSTRFSTGLLWGLVLVLFLAARVPARPFAGLVLPPLLLVCWLALRRGVRERPDDDALAEILGRVRPLNVLVMSLMPLAAIAAYACLHGPGLTVATNVLLYLITMPLGFWFFFRGLWRAFTADSASMSPLSREKVLDWCPESEVR